MIKIKESYLRNYLPIFHYPYLTDYVPNDAMLIYKTKYSEKFIYDKNIYVKILHNEITILVRRYELQ